MRIYTDLFSEEEIISDGYKMEWKYENTTAEIKGKMVVVGSKQSMKGPTPTVYSLHLHRIWYNAFGFFCAFLISSESLKFVLDFPRFFWPRRTEYYVISPVSLYWLPKTWPNIWPNFVSVRIFRADSMLVFACC